MTLMHWAANTSRIRLGTAVVVAPYWHPIRVAGEAALFDVYSDGRLELGLGRGAFSSPLGPSLPFSFSFGSSTSFGAGSGVGSLPFLSGSPLLPSLFFAGSFFGSGGR